MTASVCSVAALQSRAIPHDNPKGKNMLEAIVIAAFVAMGSQVPSTFFGPHQSAPSDCEKVAITSERTGEVLYYNCAR